MYASGILWLKDFPPLSKTKLNQPWQKALYKVYWQNDWGILIGYNVIVAVSISNDFGVFRFQNMHFVIICKTCKRGSHLQNFRIEISEMFMNSLFYNTIGIVQLVFYIFIKKHSVTLLIFCFLWLLMTFLHSIKPEAFW